MARKRKGRAWANLKDVLPEPPAENNEYLQRVFAEKDKLANHTMAQLEDEYKLLEEEEAVAAAAASERGIKYNAIERRMLEELTKVQEVAGTDMWRGNGVSVSPRYTPQPIVRDRAALLKWLKESNLADLLTLSTQALKGIVTQAYNTDIPALLTPEQREALSKNPGAPGSLQPPPGVEVYLRPGINRTTARGNVSQAFDDDGDE